jgi:hypothetical protein
MRGKRTAIGLLMALSMALSLLLAAPVQAAGQGAQIFVIPLSGAEEVPARDTPASGLAVFVLSRDQESLRFTLLAFNIENVVFSHIHNGATGVNGPVVAFLLHDQPPGGGPHTGVLSTGLITEDDLVGPFAGMDFSVLVDAITSGNAYVNVHTNDGVAPTNTGPGDFPGGELRGQFD